MYTHTYIPKYTNNNIPLVLVFTTKFSQVYFIVYTHVIIIENKHYNYLKIVLVLIGLQLFDALYYTQGHLYL